MREPLGRRAAARVTQPLVSDRRGQLVAGALLCGYLAALLAVGGHDHWDVFWVPDLQPTFLDLRSVTTAWECTREGVEVLASNPCDPYGRQLAYPRVWLAPAWLGLGEETTTVLGVGIGLLFFASFFLLIGREVSALAGLVYGLALTSPAVMLGIERGNADVAVFVVLFLAIVLFRARRAWLRLCAHGLFLLAAMLKLFPAFAFGVLARQPLRWRLLGGGAVLVLFATYLLATLNDVSTIVTVNVVPQEILFSYGAGVGLDAFLDGSTKSAVTVSLVLAALLLAGAIATLLRPSVTHSEVSDSERRACDAFVVGAGVYVGTFASLAHHWDYRLIFLLLVMPQTVRWAKRDDSPLPAPRLTLAAILGTFWLGGVFSTEEPGLPLEELVNWFLFVNLASALFTLAALHIRRVDARRVQRAGARVALKR